MTSALLPEYRCQCGKLLFKGALFISVVEIKCRYCHQITVIRDINQALLGPTAFAVVFDEHGAIVNFSERAPEFLGYTPEELSRMNAFMLNTVITPTLYRKLWLERLNEPKSQASIFLRRRDGAMFAAAIMFKFVTVGAARYLFGIIDVANEQISDTDGTLAPPWVGGRTGEIYIELDLQGICRPDVIRGSEQIGYARADLPGRSITDLCPRLLNLIGGKTFSELCAQQVSFEVLDNAFRAADESFVAVESYFVPSYEGGSFSGYWVCSWITSQQKHTLGGN